MPLPSCGDRRTQNNGVMDNAPSEANLPTPPPRLPNRVHVDTSPLILTIQAQCITNCELWRVHASRSVRMGRGGETPPTGGSSMQTPPKLALPPPPMPPQATPPPTTPPPPSPGAANLKSPSTSAVGVPRGGSGVEDVRVFRVTKNRIYHSTGQFCSGRIFGYNFPLP